MESRRAQLNGQLKALIEAENAFSGLAGGAKAILQQAKNGQLKGKYSALTSLLEVPKEYEQAIASVLGEFLDAIYLAEDTDEDQAVSWLGSSDQGRAALFPISSLIESRPKSDFTSIDGVIGLASELIKAPPELQRVVTAALGNAWIVKDRGAARKIARSKGNSARAVTLNGEVFLSNGAVIAGREGRGSLISRPRERKELESVLDQVDRDLKASSQEISNSDGVLHSLREEELQIQQSRQQAEENARKLTQKTQKATLDLNQLTNKSTGKSNK